MPLRRLSSSSGSTSLSPRQRFVFDSDAAAAGYHSAAVGYYYSAASHYYSAAGSPPPSKPLPWPPKPAGAAARSPTAMSAISPPDSKAWKCCQCNKFNHTPGRGPCPSCGLHRKCAGCIEYVKTKTEWTCCMCGRSTPMAERSCSGCCTIKGVCCSEMADWVIGSWLGA